MLCLVGALLMQLKVSPTKWKMALDVRSSLGVSFLQYGLRVPWICVPL